VFMNVNASKTIPEAPRRVFVSVCRARFLNNFFIVVIFVEIIDECADPSLHICDPNAICMDNLLSYECLCKEGYIDMSEVPSVRPGVKCLPRKCLIHLFGNMGLCGRITVALFFSHQRMYKCFGDKWLSRVCRLHRSSGRFYLSM
jgi:hypothetical protein